MGAGSRLLPAGVKRQSLLQGDFPQCGEMSAKLTEGTAQLAWDSVPQSFKRSEKGEFLAILKRMAKKREKLCKREFFPCKESVWVDLQANQRD